MGRRPSGRDRRGTHLSRSLSPSSPPRPASRLRTSPRTSCVREDVKNHRPVGCLVCGLRCAMSEVNNYTAVEFRASHLAKKIRTLCVPPETWLVRMLSPLSVRRVQTPELPGPEALHAEQIWRDAVHGHRCCLRERVPDVHRERAPQKALRRVRHQQALR